MTGVTIIAYRGHCVAFRQLTKEIDAACVCVTSTTWSFGEPFSDREKWSGTLNLYTCNYCRCVKMMPIRHYNLRNKLLKKSDLKFYLDFFTRGLVFPEGVTHVSSHSWKTFLPCTVYTRVNDLRFKRQRETTTSRRENYLAPKLKGLRNSGSSTTKSNQKFGVTGVIIIGWLG